MEEREEEKRGRKKKGEKKKVVIREEQSKFFVDLSRDKLSLEMIFSILKEANQKEYGSEIGFKEIALFGIKRLTKKEIEKIKEDSLSDMEKVERAFRDFNEKTGGKHSLGEFLLKKLNLN